MTTSTTRPAAKRAAKKGNSPFPPKMIPDFSPNAGELGVLYAGSISGIEALMEAYSVAYQGTVRLMQREQEALAETMQSWRTVGEALAAAKDPAEIANVVEAAATNSRTRWVEASRDLFEIAVQWQEDAWTAYWAQIEGALASGEKIVESSREVED